MTLKPRIINILLVMFSTGMRSVIFSGRKMNNPAAEQRGISKCIERPKGRGITPGEIKIGRMR